MIKIGETYIFTKSGNSVKVLEKTSIQFNSKKLSGFTVERIDTQKRMFVPNGSLKTTLELGLD